MALDDALEATKTLSDSASPMPRRDIWIHIAIRLLFLGCGFALLIKTSAITGKYHEFGDVAAIIQVSIFGETKNGVLFLMALIISEFNMSTRPVLPSSPTYLLSHSSVLSAHTWAGLASSMFVASLPES